MCANCADCKVFFGFVIHANHKDYYSTMKISRSTLYVSKEETGVLKVLDTYALMSCEPYDYNIIYLWFVRSSFYCAVSVTYFFLQFLHFCKRLLRWIEPWVCVLAVLFKEKLQKKEYIFSWYQHNCSFICTTILHTY